MKYFNYIFFILTFFFIINFKTSSQLITRPLILNKIDKNIRLDNEKIDTILLPIFEDFSKYNDSISESYTWSNTKSILIKDLPENEAPSIGVAVFDGINQYGIPYNESSQYVGLADSLTSNIINLDSYVNDNDLYFSFFWNINKYSEYPHENDSIRLQFMNNENKWETVWKVDGNTSINEEAFNQEIINLNNNHLHQNFRFRYQNFGKLNGPFDSWVIDYLYLNNSRESSDTIYIDRSLTYKPKNIFGDFTSIPIEQLKSDPDFFLDTIHVGFNNFNDQIQPIEYNCIIYDMIENNPIDTVSWKVPLDPLVQGFEKRVIFSDKTSYEAFGKSHEVSETCFYVLKQRKRVVKNFIEYAP